MLDPTILDGELVIPSFNIFRKDRNQYGGGVVTYAHESFNVTVKDLESSAEALCLELASETTMLVLLCVYRPPSDNNGLLIPSLLQEVNNMTVDTPLLICGDFNFPYIDWEQNTHKGSASLYEPFMSTVTDLGLTQHVFHPTHVHGNILDLTFSSEMIVHDITIAPPVISDHSLITISLKLFLKSNKVPDSKIVYQFHKVDTTKAYSIFSSWKTSIDHAIRENKSIDDVYDIFVQSLFHLRDNCVPTITLKKQSEGPSWMTKILKKALHQQRQHYSAMKKFPSEYNVNRYKVTRKKKNCQSGRLKRVISTVSYINHFWGAILSLFIDTFVNAIAMGQIPFLT